MLIESTLKKLSTVDKEKILKTEAYVGEAPLFIAAENGHLKACDVLLGYGFGVDGRSASDGATPLYIAAQNGHLQVKFFFPFLCFFLFFFFLNFPFLGLSFLVDKGWEYQRDDFSGSVFAVHRCGAWTRSHSRFPYSTRTL